MAESVVKSLRCDPILWEKVERYAAERRWSANLAVVALIEEGLKRSPPKETLQASDGRRPEVEPVRTKPEGRGSRPADPKERLERAKADGTVRTGSDLLEGVHLGPVAPKPGSMLKPDKGGKR
jgi:hypothetical protein